MGASSFSQSVVVLTWQVEEKGQPWSLNNPAQRSLSSAITDHLSIHNGPMAKTIVHVLDATPSKYSYKLLYYLPIKYAIKVQNQVLMSMFYVVPPPLLGYLSDFVRRQVLSGRY